MKTVNIHETVTRRKQKTRQLQLIKSASPRQKKKLPQSRKEKKKLQQKPQRELNIHLEMISGDLSLQWLGAGLGFPARD